jgi:periplasmic divalent cation tolerance protein
MSTDVRLVVCTFGSAEEAASVGRTVVEEQLAACMNIVPGVRSIYVWEDELCDDEEVVALLKTTRDRFDALRDRIVALHSYDCPEVLALPVDAGHAGYLDWVAASVRG